MRTISFFFDFKPLSVNARWQGRRFKTGEYKVYEFQTLRILPPLDIPNGKLEIKYTVGVSSKNADIDNPIKPFQDILQKKYGFNDRNIYRISIEKVDTKKGEEFIAFEISSLE